jgi:BolA family transcriptional regulator, general stress-responsive regulator
VSGSRREQIEAILVDRFRPSEIRVKDQSHLHAGHAGAADGRGHFDVYIVAEEFTDHSRVRRHQLVYDALAELLQSDIHALSIRALSPGEAAGGRHAQASKTFNR